MFRSTCARIRSRSIPMTSPMTGREWATRLPGAEDLLELVRRRDLELTVSALARRLVGAPALEHRRVAEAWTLHVVVLDLAHALDAQRLPRQVLARAPSTLTAWHSRALAVYDRPVAPRMP